MMWFQIALFVLKLLMELRKENHQAECLEWMAGKIGKRPRGMTEEKIKTLFEEFKREKNL